MYRNGRQIRYDRTGATEHRGSPAGHPREKPCAPGPAVATVHRVADATANPTDIYRRRARRLRHVYARDPIRLQRSLSQLARSSDRRATAARGLAPASAVWSANPRATEGRDASAAQTFAGVVAERTTGPVLPYSDREHLLRRASRMGIGRFEANLIIAAVQHRAAREQPEQVIQATASGARAPVLFLTAAVVQAAIVAGVRWIAF